MGPIYEWIRKYSFGSFKKGQGKASRIIEKLLVKKQRIIEWKDAFF